MTGHGAVHTRGYADPLIVSSGEFSPKTDAYAVGITLLVCLTGRAADGIVDACEKAFDADFADIDAGALADASGGWPADAARTVCCVARSRESVESLCSPSKRRRLALSAAHASLAALLAAGSSSGDAVDVPLPSDAPLTASALQPQTRGQPAVSAQVRALRSGDADEGLKRNMLDAFTSLMQQLNVRYAASAAVAPASFEERLNYWHASCGMSAALRRDMHRLRVWSNAARHHDGERWRRDGPRSAHEASQLVAAISDAISAEQIVK